MICPTIDFVVLLRDDEERVEAVVDPRDVAHVHVGGVVRAVRQVIRQLRQVEVVVQHAGLVEAPEPARDELLAVGVAEDALSLLFFFVFLSSRRRYLTCCYRYADEQPHLEWNSHKLTQYER